MNPEERARDVRMTPRLVIGLAIMLAGFLLAVDSLGLVDADRIFRFWPVVLIAVGVTKLLGTAGQRSGAFVWLVAGTALLALNLGFLSFPRVAAIVLFLVGARIAWKALRPARAPSDTSAALDIVQFLGGTKTQVTTGDFRGGQATAVMGGCEIDFRHASMPEGRAAVLDTFALWGGIEIKVPEDWEIVSQGSAVLGAFVNNARSSFGAKRRLVITGLAIMGGVEVKN
jgi:predicted membrane protein